MNKRDLIREWRTSGSARRTRAGTPRATASGTDPCSKPAATSQGQQQRCREQCRFTDGEAARGDLFVGNNSTANATNYITPPYAHFGQLVQTDRFGTNFFVTDRWADFDIVP